MANAGILYSAIIAICQAYEKSRLFLSIYSLIFWSKQVNYENSINFRSPEFQPVDFIMMLHIKKLYLFYKEGFTNMPSWGKQAWLVIIIKLFVMFVVLKIFFFPNFLKTNYKTDADRSNHVLENLTNINP